MSEFAMKTVSVVIEPRPARRRGRPLKDGPDRREDIIDASTHLFLKDGYTSTTLRRIAHAANVNVALVHYYFTSKQGLYQEVLNSALQATLCSLKDFQRTTPSVDEIARTLTAPLYKHPDLIQSLNTPNAPPEARDAAEAVMRRLSLSLTACIKSLQRAGTLRCDLDPELFAQTCLELCWAPFKSDQSGTSIEEEAARTCNPTELLTRHVEQNTLVLASAAACLTGDPKSAEKKGDPDGPPFRHFPEKVI
ncbi:MAG: TetR/AcrR family transcriptional regulator [Rhodobiaceae bacterium]|nr:TetR/AcrR family transcriptional regulator [Rhodobiaceae bacterium]